MPPCCLPGWRLPKLPGGIFTGADELPFGRSMAMSATLRSELLDREQLGVAAVNVVADLELAVIVDERGLIGEVVGNAGREIDS